LGREPGDIGRPRAADGPSLEPAPPPEDRMLFAQCGQAPREVEQNEVGVLPVVPGDLVVLAVRVVVAALRAADLVAAQDHRHTLRDEQRREQVLALPAPLRDDVRIVGRTLGAAVPRSVVALAVAVLLAVLLVVLLV